MHPGHPAICGAAELSATALGSSAPSLILESMTHAAGLINGEPLLVPSSGISVGLKARPSLAEIHRAVHVIAERLEKAEIEKVSYLIGLQHRVAAENIGFQDAGERPGRTAISRISPATLPEVGLNTVKLPPADCHPVVVRWIDSNRCLIRRVAENVIPARVDVYLETGKQTESRNHP